MEVFGVDIGQLMELGTQVADMGALRAGELVADQMFDTIVGIAILVYETKPV